MPMPNGILRSVHVGELVAPGAPPPSGTPGASHVRPRVGAQHFGVSPPPGAREAPPGARLRQCEGPTRGRDPRPTPLISPCANRIQITVHICRGAHLTRHNGTQITQFKM